MFNEDDIDKMKKGANRAGQFLKNITANSTNVYVRPNDDHETFPVNKDVFDMIEDINGKITRQMMNEQTDIDIIDMKIKGNLDIEYGVYLSSIIKEFT